MRKSEKARHIIFGMLLMFVISSTIVPAIAAAVTKQITVTYDDIKVVANGMLIDESVAGIPINPFMLGGVTYIPARAIGEALCDGITSWDADTHTLYLGPRTAPKPSGAVKLSDLNHLSIEGYINYEKEVKDNTDTFRYDCFTFYTYSDGEYLNFYLNKQYSKIDGLFFLTFDSRSSNAEMRLKMWGDGKLLYTSDRMSGNVLPFNFNVDITGVEILKIGMEHDNGRGEAGLSQVTLHP